MTQQEFVKKEAKAYWLLCDTRDKEENFSDGLTKGLEIAEEIIQQLTGEDKERSKLLLNKFLTQKYEE